MENKNNILSFRGQRLSAEEAATLPVVSEPSDKLPRFQYLYYPDRIEVRIVDPTKEEKPFKASLSCAIPSRSVRANRSRTAGKAIEFAPGLWGRVVK